MILKLKGDEVTLVADDANAEPIGVSTVVRIVNTTAGAALVTLADINGGDVSDSTNVATTSVLAGSEVVLVKGKDQGILSDVAVLVTPVAFQN